MSQETLDLAEKLYLDLVEDIEKAKTREEHIRVTARANIAKAIFQGLSDEVTA
jgi:hypothetical protein